MLPGGQQALQNQYFEILEHVTLYAAHNVDLVVCEFEGGKLEAEISSGRGRQNESIVDMDHMALIVEENIAVMPVTMVIHI